MKKKLNFLLCCFIMAMVCNQTEINAQNPDTLWTLKLPGSSWQTQLLYLIPTQDNNYVAGGLYYTEETQTDIWIVKFTTNGEIIWNKTFQTDNSQPWLVESIRCLAEMSTGEVVIFAANHEWKHYLIFPDLEGNLSSMSNYLVPGEGYYAYTGTVTDDYNLLVAGFHAVNVDGNSFTYSWYRKIDVSGNIIWERSLPPLHWHDTFNCIGKMPDDGFILAGDSDTPTNSDEILLVRIDSQGDTLWTRHWGTSVSDHPEEIVPTPDGGFILATRKMYMSNFKGLLIKLDAQGNETWMQSYNDYDEDEIHSVKPTLDGGYIIAGEHIPSNSTRSKFWVMKTDQQGNKIQSFELGNESDFYRGRSIVQCDDGSYIAVGQTSTDGLIVKFSPYFGTLGIEEPIKTSGFLISQNYPNPFERETFIDFQLPQSTNVKIQVFDILGNEIKMLMDQTLPAGKHQAIFQAEKLSNGIYFCRISAGQNIGLIKMSVVK